MITDLVHLRTFVTVAEEQHLTRAAERLNMSQSAASAHIRAVEDRLGTQLFVRTNRRLELTHVGELVAKKARELLSEETLFRSFVRELNGQIEGRLVLGTSSAPGTRVGEILTKLRAGYPLVRVDIMARPSTGTRQGLSSGELDVGVLLSVHKDAAFTYHRLTTVRYRVAGPASWRAQIEEADWRELADLPWLMPSASSAYSSMIANMFAETGLEPNSVMRFDNSSVGYSALKAGAGMMLLREDEALQGEQEGSLAISPIAHAEVELSVAYQTARANDPLVKAFVDAAAAVWKFVPA